MKFVSPGTIKHFDTIKNINFISSSGGWIYKYVHTTSSYTMDNYCINSESENGRTPIKKRSNVSIVYRKKKNSYTINVDDKRSVIRIQTKNNEPHLYSIEYVDEFDDDEILSTMKKYRNNKDIPEWLAINLLLRIAKKKIDHEKIAKIFS